MRKVIWCCSAAGGLAAGSFLALAYHACCCPDSMVGRAMQVIAEASIAMQPLSGITTVASRTHQSGATANETGTSQEECVPGDPQPVAVEQKREIILASRKHEVEMDAAPIVIPEEDPMPEDQAAAIPPSAIALNERNFDSADMLGQEVPRKSGPAVMPRCQDEDAEPTTPKKPRAEGGVEAEESVFKAWMDLFKENKAEKAPAVEELPPPEEVPAQGEPKCQEDNHLHEQYPGCPRTSCPYTGKDRMEKYFKRVWDLDSKLKKKGSEESSEEPNPSNDCKDKENCPRTKGVDTMEYRKSDARLDEYGPGEIH